MNTNPWNAVAVSADFGQNRAVVLFSKPGGKDSDPVSVSVTFPLVDNNKPPPQSADRQALIKQAKQILTDANGSAQFKAL